MELKDLGLQRINLDLSNNITGNFFAKEGDVGTRGLSIKVLNNSVEIDTTGVSVTMYARVGQEVYSVDATVKDALKGEYELIYPTSILKSGIVYAELQLKKLNDIISTKKFKILVESGIVTDSAIEGHDSYPIFEQLLEAGANEEERIANESIRIAGEEDRDLSESERLSSEVVRKEKEVKRESNEDVRKSNELARKENEEVRESNELTRKENEEVRESNELTRKENEEVRVSSEEGRGLAESERALQEITRKSNEEIRKLNEIARIDAEDLRVLEDANREQRILGVEEDLTSYKEEIIQQRQLPHFNHAAQEYINLDQFWNNLRDGKIYTTEFNQFAVSPAPNGTKLDDNTGLIMEPSTNIVAGRDDYSKIGLFKPIEVNAYVDENDDYHVIAIQGDGRFKRDGSMGDVYIMNMTGYTKYVADDLKWSISYSDSMHAGFEVIQEAIKPDGTIRPYLLHAKYVAGRNPLDGKLASISGVYAEYVNMSHNSQITEFKAKGTQYSGKTSHDDFWVQLLMWLKYATTNSDSIMRGCQSYYLQYTNLVAEIGVNRVVITNAQANALVIGSTVSIGDCEGSTDTSEPAQTRNFNIVNRVNITSIVDLGDGKSAIYVNSPIFNTKLTTTITTYPWNSGGCDKVLGVDGSPYSNLSGKEPFIIGGIEMMVGGYEVLQNLIILNNAVDNRIDVYANYDCKTYATSITSDYDLVGQLAQTNNSWKYGSKMVMSNLHPSIILVTDASASSTTGNGDGIYTNTPSTRGTRVWLSLGYLRHGAVAGLRYLSADGGLSYSGWSVLGRLSATGRSRRRI